MKLFCESKSASLLFIKEGNSSLKDKMHDGSNPTTGTPFFKKGKNVFKIFSYSFFVFSINP